jgi:hypothetical protein
MDRVENDIRLRRWMAFDPSLTDEQVAECIYPYIPVEIRREENSTSAIVVYYSDDHKTGLFRERMDKLESLIVRPFYDHEKRMLEIAAKLKDQGIDLTEPKLW